MNVFTFIDEEEGKGRCKETVAAEEYPSVVVPHGKGRLLKNQKGAVSAITSTSMSFPSAE
jgi:hypothetical protein